jgi:protein-S-isoprenylcysteine O-methyltransferase Ste14
MFRWLSLAILLTAVGTSGYYRWHARQSETIARSREGPLFVAFRLLVALPLLLGIVAYIVNPSWMAWATLDVPDWIRWAGVGLGALTIPAVFWVFRNIGRNVSETVLTKRDHQLVTTGPYRWIRHPLYTTGSGLLLSIGLMHASWFVLILAAIAAVLVRTVVIPIEERALVEKFGDRYRAYMDGTGAMFPRTGFSSSRSTL